jgi:hypothetical protein
LTFLVNFSVLKQPDPQLHSQDVSHPCALFSPGSLPTHHSRVTQPSFTEPTNTQTMSALTTKQKSNIHLAILSFQEDIQGDLCVLLQLVVMILLHFFAPHDVPDGQNHDGKSHLKIVHTYIASVCVSATL